MKKYSYSVAIRTLGTAGDKFQQELDSILAQTIQPEKVVVYIAEGYSIPKETIGIEQYVYVKKGMMTQRALQYNEIDSEYILMLDDDALLPSYFVEKMFDALYQYDGDCISPNIYSNHQMSFFRKVTTAIGAFVFPRKNDGWAFTVGNSGAYSYNNNPKQDVLLTETAAGLCCLCKKSSFLNVKLEDECWIDKFGYPLGEDQLLYNKLYVNGYKVLLYYNTGIIHNDGKTGHTKKTLDKVEKEGVINYIIWFRTCFSIRNNKLFCVVSYFAKIFSMFCYKLIVGILKSEFFASFAFCRGVINGYKFCNTSEYKKINKFLLKK